MLLLLIMIVMTIVSEGIGSSTEAPRLRRHYRNRGDGRLNEPLFDAQVAHNACHQINGK